MKQTFSYLLLAGLLSGASVSAQITLSSWDFSNAVNGGTTIESTTGTATLTVGGGASGDFKAINSDYVSLQKGNKWNGARFTMTFDNSTVSNDLELSFNAQWKLAQANVWGVTTAQTSYSTDGGVNFTDIGSAFVFNGDQNWNPYSLNLGKVLSNTETAAIRLTFSGGAANWSANAQTNFDDITITSVPEPTTYVLIGGLVAMGLALLRRRRG